DSSVKTAEMLAMYTFYQFYAPVFSEFVRNPGLDCCNSLLQSICKTIITQIDSKIEVKSLNKGAKSETNNLISEAAKLLQKNDDVYERDFISKLSQIGKHINELRNARGDLSHGKQIPKELLNDQDLPRLLREITESLSRYLISSFFSFALEKKSKEDFEIEEDVIRYEDNPEFNDLLDEEYPLDGKLLYSQGLHTLLYEDYEIRLQAFLDEQALLDEE
ncbi:MAG: abortive infection family protein, partial [Nostoc sp.]